MEELFESLKKLKLPEGDHAVFGSGPLFVSGIISNITDLDVICRGVAWEKVQEFGTLQYNDVYDVAIVTVNEGQMTFGNSWGIGDLNVDDLIYSAEYIDNVPFVQVRHILEYKMQRASANDLRHIESPKRSKYFALAGRSD